MIFLHSVYIVYSISSASHDQKFKNLALQAQFFLLHNVIVNVKL